MSSVLTVSEQDGRFPHCEPASTTCVLTDPDGGGECVSALIRHDGRFYHPLKNDEKTAETALHNFCVDLPNFQAALLHTWPDLHTASLTTAHTFALLVQCSPHVYC